MDCNPPDSSVHEMVQARILEWLAFPSFRGSSQPRYQTPHLLRLQHCRQILYPLSHLGSPSSSISQFSQSVSSVAQSYLTLCDPMNRSTPEFTQTHAHQVGDAIQPSHPLSSPSPPAPNPSQHQGLFQWVNSSHEIAKVLEFPLQHQSFQWTPRTDLLQDGLIGSPGSPKDSQEFSPTPQFKRINFSVLTGFFTVQLSHPYMTTGKTIALTRRTFVGKVMSLLFHMLSRLVITFLPRSKCLLISWLQSPSAVILEPKKIKSDTVCTVSPSISHEVMGPDAMILVFWISSINENINSIFFTALFREFSRDPYQTPST